MDITAYKTLSGRDLVVPTTRDRAVSAFLGRLQRMLDDPKATEREMIALAYSRENPILDHTVFGERGAVTREVLDDPAYHIVTDLLTRKHVVEHGVDLAQVAAQYTLGVPAAAARAGVHESAVRQAIKSYRLPVWVRDGKYFVTPDSVDLWNVGTRGPKPKVPRPKRR